MAIAVQRRAPGTGSALVARRGAILEVRASGALQQIPRRGGEIAQLTGGSGNERLREDRVAPADQRMGGEFGVAHSRTHSHRAVLELAHFVQRQLGDIHQQLGAGDAELHVVHQVRPAREKRGVGPGADEHHRLLGIGGALVVERLHPAACSIAATMPT